METKGFAKARTQEFSGVIGMGEVDDTFSRVIADTVNQELATKKAGLSVEEYEKIKKEKLGYKRPTSLGKKETRSGSASEEKYDSLASWVYGTVPAELHNARQDVYKEVVQIFQKESRGPSFIDIWNYKIVIPKGLNEETLIRYSSQKIESLEDLSRIDLNLFKISESKNFLEEVNKIENLIKSLKEEKREIPSQGIYNISKELFVESTLSYLIKMIVIEKLEEILVILNQYEII